jgi:hypothetical protein
LGVRDRRFLNSRATWATERVPVLKKNKKKKEEKKFAYSTVFRVREEERSWEKPKSGLLMVLTLASKS